MRKMKGVHEYEPSIHIEKDKKKMASYICDCKVRRVDMTLKV